MRTSIFDVEDDRKTLDDWSTGDGEWQDASIVQVAGKRHDGGVRFENSQLQGADFKYAVPPPNWDLRDHDLLRCSFSYVDFTGHVCELRRTRGGDVKCSDEWVESTTVPYPWLVDQVDNDGWWERAPHVRWAHKAHDGGVLLPEGTLRDSNCFAAVTWPSDHDAPTTSV